MTKLFPKILLVLVFALIPVLLMTGQAHAAIGQPTVVVNTTLPTWGGVEIAVTITTTGGGSSNDWRGTEFRYGTEAWRCVDTDNHTSSGTYTETFAIPAPLPGGSTALTVRGREESDCSGNTGSISNAQTVTIAENNPNIAEACGIDLTLILDESGSIQGIGGAADIRSQVRSGAIDVWDALQGTGSTMAIVEFNTTARQPFGATRIDITAANRPSFVQYVNATGGQPRYEPADYGDPNYFTNWEDAFDIADDINHSDGAADLLVFFTDGVPTTNSSYEGSDPASDINIDDQNEWVHAGYAAFEANHIKGDGTHILGVGIANPSDPGDTLPYVSGSEEFVGGNVATADWTTTTGSGLGAELRALVLELCQSSVTVTKELYNPDTAAYEAVDGWDFAAEVTNGTAAPFKWELPGPPANVHQSTNSGTTGQGSNATGTLLFQWEPDGETDIEITETLQAGYEFVDYACEDQDSGNQTSGTELTADLSIAIDAFYKCLFRNTEVVLNIDKTGPATAAPGGQYTYTITYGNSTTDDDFSSTAYDPVITDDLDSQLTFVSGTAPAPGSCSAAGQLVTCSGMPDLPEGTTAQVTITVEVQDSDYTVVTVPNTACVDADTSNGDPLTQECDDHDVTTPVTVGYFAASVSGSGVVFDWSTATETGNAGFNIYAQTADGPLLVNDDLILSQAVDSSVRLDYSYVADAFGASEFYIEDVGVFGDRRMHGPFALGETYGARLEADPIDWATIRAEHQALDAARVVDIPQMAVQAAFATNALEAYPLVELRLTEDGIYRVTYKDLVAAGIDLRGVRASHLALTNNGERVPLRYFGRKVQPGFFIEFLGKGEDTLYTDENVYVLQVDRKLRSKMPSNRTAVARGAVLADHYLETAAFEGNNAYTYLATNGDPWYDTLLLASKSTSWDFTMDAENYVRSAGPAWLNLELWGANEIEHHVVASVNGEEVANLLFTDKAVETVRVPVGNLKSGPNTLVLTAPNDQGAAFDMTILESYGLTYPRAFVARDGRLSFTASGEVFKVTNLPSKRVVVYFDDETDGPQRITRVKKRGRGSYYATFAGVGSGTYYVSAEDALLKPQISLASPAADITSGSADLLIVSHANFIPGLAPLVQAREAQGYDVKVVDVNAVYKAYSGGVFDAEAIRLYINHAIKNMGVDYVLLVGADSYNYRGYGGSLSLSFIPSLYTQTSEGVRFAPVDPLYTDVNGDGVPDAAIGRFPVYTPADLALMVEKTLLYENKNYSKSAVFAADRGFGSQSDEFVSALDGGWSFDEVYLDKIPVGDAKTALVASLNQGVALASFVGHSGKTHWTFDPLFTSSDAESLTNYGRPAAVAQWGCWNAYYVDPEYSTLGHKLLLSGTNGAAMVAGSTTITKASSEYKLGKLMMPLLSESGMTSGEAMLSAKTALAQSDPELLDVLLGWTILGDPTVKIQP